MGYPIVKKTPTVGSSLAEDALYKLAQKVDSPMIKFLIKYYSQPETLSAAAQVPNIPAAWHEPIWMLAAWLRHTEDKATDEANAMFRDVTAYMQLMQQERDTMYNFRNSRVYYNQ